MGETPVGLKLPKTNGDQKRPAWMSAGEWGERAETLGYESVWVSEGWGSDAILDLAEIAYNTDTLRLATAIVNPYSRTPALLAMSMSTLAQQSGGRAILGLGASHPGFVEDIHGLSYERPITRSGEAIELVKKLVNGKGETVSFDGEIFDISDIPALDTPLPVYNAALGPVNRRMTGALADGWIPYLIPFSQLPDAFETIAESAEDANRDPEDITVAPQVLVAVSEDEEYARNLIAQYVASYIGRHDNYLRIIGQTYPSEAESIADTWRDGREDAAVELVSDEMIDDFGAAGSIDEARTRFNEIRSLPFVDRPILYVPDVADRSLTEQTIDALAPENL